MLPNVFIFNSETHSDHGLETPDVRTVQGKKESETITLEFEQQDNYALIRLFVDGRGLALD